MTSWLVYSILINPFLYIINVIIYIITGCIYTHSKQQLSHSFCFCYVFGVHDILACLFYIYQPFSLYYQCYYLYYSWLYSLIQSNNKWSLTSQIICIYCVCGVDDILACLFYIFQSYSLDYEWLCILIHSNNYRANKSQSFWCY